MLCGNKSHNNDHSLKVVVICDFLITLKKSGDEIGDEGMRDRVGDFNKPIALEVQIEKTVMANIL